MGRDFFQTVWVVSQSTAWRKNNEKFFVVVFALIFGNKGNLGEMAPCVKRYCTYTEKAMISSNGLHVFYNLIFVFDLHLLSLIVR